MRVFYTHYFFFFFFLPFPPFFFLLRLTQSFLAAVIWSPSCLKSMGAMESLTSKSITCGICFTARGERGRGVGGRNAWGGRHRVGRTGWEAWGRGKEEWVDGAR